MNKKGKDRQPTSSLKANSKKGDPMNGYVGDKKLAGPNRPST